MAQIDLNLKTTLINMYNIEEIICSIVGLGSEDCDFNGENGEDYLWEEAEKGGFESNMEYVEKFLIDKYKDTKFDRDTLCKVINEFLSLWIGRDSYYDDYSWEIEDVNDEQLVLALAYTTGC